MALVLVVVAAVIGAAAWGGLALNARWGRHAMVSTALTGIEALIHGNSYQLAAVSNAAVKAQLTTALRQDMSDKGIDVDFSAPAWTGDSVEVTATGAMGPGVVVAGPANDGANVVVFQTMGSVSFTNGAITLVRTGSGWSISGLSVKASKVPTMAPSGTATSTAPATTPATSAP